MGGDALMYSALREQLRAQLARTLQRRAPTRNLIRRLKTELEQARLDLKALRQTVQRSADLCDGVARPASSARAIQAWARKERDRAAVLDSRMETLRKRLDTEQRALRGIEEGAADLQSRIDLLDGLTSRLSRDRRTQSLEKAEEYQLDQLTGRPTKD